MKKFVAGNWKMNGNSAVNAALVDTLERISDPEIDKCVDRALCVPFPYLAQMKEALQETGIALGAQNVSEFASGAYTGEVSAAMLAEFGCRHVIVGHSERRILFGESDSQIANKTAIALETSLEPIVCIGETEAQRKAGREKDTVAAQLQALSAIFLNAQPERLTLAYEPVWAIGTGKTASVEQVAAMHDFIREWLSERMPCAQSVRILYGGSVKADNAEALFDIENVDGGLIGGASLVAEEFLEICRAAAKPLFN